MMMKFRVEITLISSRKERKTVCKQFSDRRAEGSDCVTLDLEALEADGRVAERYVRRDDLLPFRICFVRADLESAPGERRARVLEALDQLPTYGTAIMRERSAAYR